ncbi:MAG TPA: FAD-dependent oxidoreductase [Candidatus Nanopelagicales bacterium]
MAALGAHRSFWMEGLGDLPEAAPPTAPTLLPADPVDLVVAGAGITGLSTALLAQEAGLRVAVLEATELLESAVTARSTVKLTIGHGALFAKIAASRGDDVAVAYARANQVGFDTMLRLAEELGIDCELEGGLAHDVYAEREDEVAQVATVARIARLAGLSVADTPSTPLPVPTTAVASFADQAQLHPGRYLLGLARAFTDAGGTLVEGVRVLDVEEDGEGCTVSTTQGSVRAGNVVVATQYPILDRGAQFARTSTRRSYAIAGILPGGVSAGMTINVGSPTHSTRTAQRDGEQYLVVVGEGHPVGRADDSAQRWDRLAQWAAEYYDVNDVRFHWSAQETNTSDHVPFIGRTAPGTKRVFTATGFSGWGMTNGTAAALLLTALVQGQEHEWTSLFDAGRALKERPHRDDLTQNAQVAATWVKDRLHRPPAADRVALVPGEAAILTVEGHKCAVHRDDSGVLHSVSATCTHLGCTVAWNTAERSWDCPCHGSRFSPDGQVLQAPATKPLPAMPLPEV